MRKQTLSDLADFKVQLDVDYGSDKSRRTELLKQLGLTDHLKRAQKNDKEALVQLLYAFKAAMSSALKGEIVEKGTMPALIDQIAGYADGLQQANVSQEFNNGGRKAFTADGIDACNKIYDEVIVVSKMASKFFER